ncbi:MAG: thiolase family protein [Geodermatophilaceae bacterium]|nr:thiolase family protein [Geodermatophilaceae bacterium]
MDAYLYAAVRTPFGRYRGGLSGIRTDDLAALPIRELLARVPSLDPAQIDDVYFGNTNGAGEENRNVARMAGLLAGLPTTVPGVTVNRLCGSGGEAIIQAARAVAVGEQRLVLAGGMEGMSRAPYVIPRPTEGLPRSMELHQTTVGWRMVNPKMPAEWTTPLGRCAEAVAQGYRIGRDAMDAYAVRSHALAHEAWEKGLHDDYVMPVDGVSRDENIRPDASMESLAKLKPAFSTDGLSTAGNSSPINDGAIATLVGPAAVGEELGLEPIGRIVASCTVGRDPQEFSIAPVWAIEKLLARTGKSVDDIAVWEINEAFAAMVLSVLHDLPQIDSEKVNVHGGAIAIGHPLGASAPRVIVEACRELRRRGGGLAVAAACIGVGQGTAVLLEV